MKKPFDFRGRTLGNKRTEDYIEKDFWDDFDDEAEYSEEYEVTGDYEVEGYETEEYAEDIVESFEAEGYEEELESSFEEEAYAEEREGLHEEGEDGAQEELYDDYEREVYLSAYVANEEDTYEVEPYEEEDYEEEDYREEVYGEEDAVEETYQEEALQEEAFDADAFVEELLSKEQEDYEDEQEYYNEDTEQLPEIAIYEEEAADIEAEEEEEDEAAGGFPFTKIMDYMVMFGAVAMVLVALILGGTYIYRSYAANQDNALKEVGAQLDDITMIGEAGLLAMSDAQKAMLAATQTPEPTETPQPSGYDEEEYRFDVNVKLSLTSIEKDLKIKFINDDTGKLVGNVPFGVEVTDASGKSNFWSDDDMDGIIYKKNLEAGKYTVKVQSLTDEKYKSYGLPTTEKSVEVKAKIVYEKVDVTAEIKDESQVDVKAEDTKLNATITEEYLQDTVGWVESTVTAGTYEEVSKGNIPDPLTLALAGNFVRLSAVTESSAVSPTEVPAATTDVPADNPAPTDTPTPTDSPSPAPTDTPVPTDSPSPAPTDTPTPTDSPSPAPTETPVPTETPAPTESPSPTPTATPSPTPTMSPSPSPTVSPSPTPTVTPVPMELTLDKKTATVYTDTPLEVKYEIKNEMEDTKVKAESSDTNVVKVEVKGGSIVITGVAQGSAVVKVTCESDIYVDDELCAVTVKLHPKSNKTTLLKDNQGRELYVFENNAYRPAYYADYYTAGAFYVRKEAKYTGWQTVEGQVRYYDATGKYVTGEQVIQGVKYNFNSEGGLVTGTGTMGIDVSKWNGTIDWNAVKNSGVSYVIIRCGYRGSSKGALIEDSKFRENIKGANAAGLKVGVYFFTQAVDKNEALEEASMVLECIKGYTISYPIFLDVEPSGGRADSLDKATRTEICKTFCETIKQYGYTPGIYANKTWLETKLDMGVLNNYKVWLAQYASEPTYQGRYDIWQYKDTGKVSGVSGNVDLNMSYLGY